MAKVSSLGKDLEQFKELFDYGHFRSYKQGYEVRVNDLDSAYILAQKIIQERKLKLELSHRDCQLRSFVVQSSTELKED